MKYLNFRSSGSKLESVTCKFTKNHTPSQYFFKQFHYKCRTAILKIASWWLFLRTTLFWKYCLIAASQRQLQRYNYFRNSGFHIFNSSHSGVMLKRNEFLWIYVGKGFRERCKHTELALNFIRKQYFLYKKPIFLSFHYS